MEKVKIKTNREHRFNRLMVIEGETVLFDNSGIGYINTDTCNKITDIADYDIEILSEVEKKSEKNKIESKKEVDVQEVKKEEKIEQVSDNKINKDKDNKQKAKELAKLKIEDLQDIAKKAELKTSEWEHLDKLSLIKYIIKKM